MIAIKNFEMPRNCRECPMHTFWSLGADYCYITGISITDHLYSRSPECPLVEIDKAAAD